MPPFRPDRLLTVLAAAGLLTGACVQQDEPGLTIAKLEASLVFGVEEIVEDAPSPAQAISQVRPVLRVPDLFVPDSNPPKPDTNSPIVISTPPPPPCPASEDIAVENSATANINTEGQGNRPLEGLYKWRVLIGSGANDAPLEENGFELRVIRNVQDVPQNQWSENPQAPPTREVFTFEEVRNISEEVRIVDENGERFELKERYLVSEYLVDTNAFSARATQGDLVTQLPRTGNPERGVVLTGFSVVDGNGEPDPEVDPFEPTNGLTLLQLPVASGEPFQSVAVDASHGNTISNDSVTGSRFRFNACGRLTDGWMVTTTQSVTDDDSETTSSVYDLYQVIAPQFGGVVMWEEVYNRTSFLRIQLHRAQLDPDPLPADGLPRLPADPAAP